MGALIPLRAEALSHRLRELGIVSAQQLELAKQELINTQERFSAILARQGLIRDAEIGRRLGFQLGSVPQPIDRPPLSTPATHEVPAAMWRSHRLVPVHEDAGTLFVATDDPLSVFALELFKRWCGCPLEAVLTREQDMVSLLERFEGAPPSAPARSEGGLAMERSDVDTTHPDSHPAAAGKPQQPAQPPSAPSMPPTRQPGAAPQVSEARPPRVAPMAVGEDEPIIQLVDSMLSEAVRMRASDIHIEPGSEALRIRYRIDGVLHDVNSPPKALHGSIVSRIKIMGGLNIAEKRLPQDGRLHLSVENRPMDVRISTLPAIHGESIVMRLLDRSQPVRGLPEMGLLPDEGTRWSELIHRSHGMVLVTGPTGSGKTTTLYGALSLLNQPDRKLITVEDPVEYQLAGVNQVLVRSSIGLTFAAGLRAMLRQAPDVIMVGEIRDQETAQIAIQAALTGHLVLSTLHTNDAPSAITRLIDMGIAPFLVSSTVQGVLAQRLVRRICPACRMTDNATPEERAFLGEPEVAQVIRSNGCEKCHGSGFFGRVGIFELLAVSEAVRRLIVTKASASAIRATALREGMRGLRSDGIAKIREGLTTMAEVLRVAAEA
ncbi:MAG: type II/IV secretion system protein [Candidatus Omnitrophica bacterium]|nr:type II/IV secretion system protein [Candidatus Omnitrophota bacterium]